MDTDECDAELLPGDDDDAALRAAIDALPDGGTLCLGGGRFVLSETVILDGREGITVRGAPPDTLPATVLDFGAQARGDAGVLVTSATNVTLEGFALEAATGDGVRVSGSSDVTLRRVGVSWPDPETRLGEDGIHVEESARVRVTVCDVMSGLGAGVRIDRSADSVIEDSGAFDFGVGFVIADSTSCEVRGSAAEINSVGVLVIDDPAVEGAATNLSVRNNFLLENVGGFHEPGSLLDPIPAGVGVAIIAADDVELSGNEIEGHASAGVLIVSWNTFAEGAELSPSRDGDGIPEEIYLHDDVFVQNGFDPPAADDPVSLLLTRSAREALADIVWEGALPPGGELTTLCVQPDEGVASTFLDLDARGGYAAASDDASPHDCTRTGHPLVLP